jgi:hypothetical protein
MTVKPRICRHTSSGYHHECHCEAVTPVENLSERYGLVGQREDIKNDNEEKKNEH